jgi:hypothetical protein
VLLRLGGGDRLAVLLRLGADLAAGRDGPVVLLCAGHQGGGLRGGAGVAAGMDSVAVLLCTVPQGGVLGGLLLCVLVSLGELLLRVLGGLLVQVAGDRQVRLGDPRLAVCLVGVGPCGSLGNPGGRLGEPRLAVSLVNVLRGVLRGVERCVHGHAARGVLRDSWGQAAASQSRNWLPSVSLSWRPSWPSRSRRW